MRGRLTGVLALAALSLSTPARPGDWAPAPLRSQVVDDGTGRPIAGAVVRLERQFVCPAFHGSYWHQQPPTETATDVRGRFTLGTLPPKPPCKERWDHYFVLAPGYLPAIAPWTRPTRLEPLRYDVERDAYRRWGGMPASPAVDSLYGRTLAAAEQLSLRPVGPPGVFVAHPGAAFDRLALARVGDIGRERGAAFTVLAQDRHTGTLHLWSLRGNVVAALTPPADTVVLAGVGPGGYPLLGQPDRMWLARTFDASLRRVGPPAWVPLAAQFGELHAGVAGGGNLVTVEAGGRALAVYLDRAFHGPRSPGQPVFGPQPSVRLEEVLGGGPARVECLTFRRHQPSEPFIAAPRQLLLIARDGETRGLFQARIGSPWQARPLDLPANAIPGEVTACTASRTALYVAVRDQGIRRLDLGPEPLPLNEVIHPDPNRHPAPRPVALGETTPPSPGLPTTFTALAVGPVRPDGDSLWEALYAVAGDSGVYRFRADLQPDRRVEPGPASTGSRPGG